MLGKCNLRKLYHSKIFLVIMLFYYLSILNLVTAESVPHGATHNSDALGTLDAADQSVSVKQHLTSDLPMKMKDCTENPEERLPVAIETILAGIKALLTKLESVFSRFKAWLTRSNKHSEMLDPLLNRVPKQNEVASSLRKDKELPNDVLYNVDLTNEKKTTVENEIGSISDIMKELKLLLNDEVSIPEALETPTFYQYVKKQIDDGNTAMIAEELNEAWGKDEALAAITLVEDTTTSSIVKNMLTDLKATYPAEAREESQESIARMKSFVNDLIIKFDRRVDRRVEPIGVNDNQLSKSDIIIKFAEWRTQLYEQRHKRVMNEKYLARVRAAVQRLV